MTAFLVEVYLPRGRGDALVRRSAQARTAAEALTSEGTPVTFLHSIFVPEDETCFFLYEAVSSDVVRAVGRRAALPFERVSEALTESEGVVK
jgi:hypothetical protein